MPRKRHKPEEIVAKLGQVDVMVSQGQPVADAVRSIGVTEVTYHRWRQEFGDVRRRGSPDGDVPDTAGWRLRGGHQRFGASSEIAADHHRVVECHEASGTDR
jgi:hypothetical protein